MPLVSSGVEHGNLRELALARMKDLGTQVRSPSIVDDLLSSHYLSAGQCLDTVGRVLKFI